MKKKYLTPRMRAKRLCVDDCMIPARGGSQSTPTVVSAKGENFEEFEEEEDLTVSRWNY